VLEINEAARELLRVLAAAPGEDLVHAVDPVLVGPLRAAIDAVIRGEPVSFVHRFPRDVVDEVGRDVLIACRPLAFDAEGAVDAAVIEATDVTALADAQRAAEAVRERVEAERTDLAARVAEAVAEVRELRLANRALAVELDRLRIENEEFQLANEEAQAAAEEIETLNEELQATNEELETLNEELQATVEELQTTNDELQARSDEILAASAELQQRRGEVEAERERTAAVLATMSDAVVALHPDGSVALTNEAYDAAFGPGAGWVPEDELGRPLPPEAWPQRRAAAGERFTAVFTLPREDGERCWFEAAAQPIRRDGTLLGVLVIRDVTDRSLRRQQEQFVAVAVHELRTPLTAMLGRLQVLSRRLERDGADRGLRDQVGIALAQARRLADDINDLMDAARVQAGRLVVERAPVDLAAVVREAVETAAPLAGETPIRIETPDAGPVVAGDGRRLRRVVLNLVANALVHAPSAAGIDVRVRRAGDEAVVEVADRGPGIAAEQLPRLFERFVQGDAAGRGGLGLGLGLFISR
jgi:two-component system, chemotaxis family, CheB/CheR fusion protein